MNKLAKKKRKLGYSPEVQRQQRKKYGSEARAACYSLTHTDDYEDCMMPKKMKGKVNEMKSHGESVEFKLHYSQFFHCRKNTGSGKCPQACRSCGQLIKTLMKHTAGCCTGDLSLCPVPASLHIQSKKVVQVRDLCLVCRGPISSLHFYNLPKPKLFSPSPPCPCCLLVSRMATSLFSCFINYAAAPCV